MNTLPPYRFKTQFLEKIWGGNKIRSVLGKDYSPLSNCGETWELSSVDGHVSVVDGGPDDGLPLNELIDKYGERLVGDRVFEKHGNDFPLLIKFIDANQDLSIQVHPGNELAAKRHNSFGKTEMWYILDSEPGAFLYNGFSRQVDEGEYEQRIADNTITDVLNRDYAEPGDVFFIPAGRVHSIGKGILLAEIQQTSDITYRIYDFDRKDAYGKGRELHTEESKAAIDFAELEDGRSSYEAIENQLTKVVNSPYFETSVLELRGRTNWVGHMGSFSIFIVAEGKMTLETVTGSTEMNLGDVWLLPAEITSAKLFSDSRCRLIETYLP